MDMGDAQKWADLRAAREMARLLRMSATPEEAPSPAPISGSPVGTPAPGDPTPLASLGPCTHVHITTHGSTRELKVFNNHNFWKKQGGVWEELEGKKVREEMMQFKVKQKNI